MPHSPNEDTFKNIKFKYKSEVLNIYIPKWEAFLIGDIFLRDEYPLKNLRGTFGRPTIIDIGANVGIFTLFAKINIPNSIIHCYEPSKKLQAALKRNTLELKDVHIHQYALSDRNGEFNLYFNPRMTGKSSLKQNPNESLYNTELVKVKKACTELEDLGLNKIDILKIDTEGSEVNILESIKEHLNKVLNIYVEYHSNTDKQKIIDILYNFTVDNDLKRGDGIGVLKCINKL